MGDVKVLDILPIEAGASGVMDRGYPDFARLYKLDEAGAILQEMRWRRWVNTSTITMKTPLARG